MSRRLPSTGTGAARAPSRAASLLPPTSRRMDSAGGRSRPASMLGTRVATEVAESSIRVAVRCRGRSRQEMREGSPIVTKTEGALSSAILVDTAPVGAATNTKTYPFDKVLGPEADQTMMFREVAQSMLDDVLGGYNCTIFAYGQTGTGKTHTMQGDLTPTPLMEPSTDAGIIPRVLHRLFSLLESSDNEYAVKCSYIEIYNEDVRDLLAPVYKDSANAPRTEIKIFEDAQKKGVTVTGVEETGLRNLKDGIAVLNKGAQRRQTAATNMNDQSSRSHSIFTLTIHVKETSQEKGGEDLLRIGKFNLVDLAGSEAIGRSGAENKRAREAGMINQSLLTLGRVISALVDKGPSTHIPYRESKLTRLLQDSLGGRTKTFIIATVSPTKSNMEETLSTLDYALRAKSIKNKPEVNAHLTKAGLMKEYVAEMERLKAELFATRDKNGIYVPEDQWEETIKTKTDYHEARQRVAAIEVQLASRKAEFEALTARFITTSEDLAAVREAERELTESLAEERAVAEAYEEGEERLHGIASELRVAAVESVRDVGGLHDKLGRMTSVLDHNADASTSFGAAIQSLSHDLKQNIARLHAVQSQFGSTLQNDLEDYAAKGEEDLETQMADLDTAFGAFAALASLLSTSLDSGHADIRDAASAVLGIKEELQANVRAWAEGVRTRSASTIHAQLREQTSAVGSVLDSTDTLLQDVIAAARDNLEAQGATFRRVHEISEAQKDAELARLQEQNALLANLLAEEQAKSARLRSSLVENVTRMITDFTEQRDASLRTAIGDLQHSNAERLRVADQSPYEGVLGVSTQAADTFGAELEQYSAAVDGQRSVGRKALGDVVKLQRRVEDDASEAAAEAEEHAQAVDGFCGRIGAAATQVAHAVDEQSRKHVADLSDLVSIEHARAAKRLKASARGAVAFSSSLLSSHATASHASTHAQDGAHATLSRLVSATDRFIGTLAHDSPTGTTPRKRTYDFPHTWERTEPRHMLVAGLRRGERTARPDSGLADRVDSVGSRGSKSRVSGASAASDSAPGSPRALRPASAASLASSLSDSDVVLPAQAVPPPALAPPVMQRQTSFGLGVPPTAPPPGLRRPSKTKLGSKDAVERVERTRLGEERVLGEGGNIPVPRRRR